MGGDEKCGVEWVGEEVRCGVEWDGEEVRSVGWVCLPLSPHISGRCHGDYPQDWGAQDILANHK